MARQRMNDLTVRYRGLATSELLDERLPLATLAQQAFHDLTEGSAPARACELPVRSLAHLRHGVRGGRGHGHAERRSEIGEGLAGVHDLSVRGAGRRRHT